MDMNKGKYFTVTLLFLFVAGLFAYTILMRW